MEKKIPELTSALREKDGVHIFYLSEEEEAYIKNILVFILDGIKNGDYIFIVENPRLTPAIYQRLEQLVTKDELKSVQFTNNFEFYWSEGNFLPVSIIEYFKAKLNEATSEEKFFRTWGHIEWGSGDDIEDEILLYDKSATQFISENKFIAVCAYDLTRVSAGLQEKLRTRHSYLMEDDRINEIAAS
ncbi:MEDS domain-containing protein [Planomicrobium okeanokoites]|uniref:MEDS domain-containing protein n=1 Tax=Planomicrobium okeanokoites TaxID=244 RepID=A0ABV7KL10_PLAOK|nr:MEDS domain-containing protein [Planomicrobium okeanokoites]TAA69448.1 3-ketoacyl-ACP reductase [Planomicrobium okeanokoites]